MSIRFIGTGIYIALTPEQKERLLSLHGDECRLDYARELERTVDKRDTQYVDKAWDPIHRCLTGDDDPENVWPDAGTYPLNQCVLGGERLYEGDDWILVLIESRVLRDLCGALESIDWWWMTRAYHKYCKGLSDVYDNLDLTYTLEHFGEVKKFLKRVEPTGRAVLFSADQ